MVLVGMLFYWEALDEYIFFISFYLIYFMNCLSDKSKVKNKPLNARFPATIFAWMNIILNFEMNIILKKSLLMLMLIWSLYCGIL